MKPAHLAIRFRSLSSGHTERRVITNLTRLFATDETQVRALLAQPGAVVQSAHTEEEAQATIKRLRKLGLVCYLDAGDGAEAPARFITPLHAPKHQGWITCPRCGVLQERADSCHACGVVIAKHLQATVSEAHASTALDPTPHNPIAAARRALAFEPLAALLSLIPVAAVGLLAYLYAPQAFEALRAQGWPLPDLSRTVAAPVAAPPWSPPARLPPAPPTDQRHSFIKQGLPGDEHLAVNPYAKALNQAGLDLGQGQGITPQEAVRRVERLKGMTGLGHPPNPAGTTPADPQGAGEAPHP